MPINCKAPTDLVCGKDGCTYENTCEAGGKNNVQCKGSCPCKTGKQDLGLKCSAWKVFGSKDFGLVCL